MAKKTENEYALLAKVLPRYVRSTLKDLRWARFEVALMFWVSFVLGVGLIVIGGYFTLTDRGLIPLGITTLGVIEAVFVLVFKAPLKYLKSKIIQTQAVAIFQGWFEVHDQLSKLMLNIEKTCGGNYAGCLPEMNKASGRLITNTRNMAEMIGIHVQRDL